MKNRNYNYKMPKAWKKKKKSTFNRKSTSLMPVKKGELPGKLNQKKYKQLTGTSSTWKLPGILFVASLSIIMLIIPTLIVMPDGSKNDKQMTVNAGQEPEETVELSAGDSPFSVEVMRASSDKVENVPLETYVSRVVASEMPSEFELEALKAQALAARTYIVDLLLNQDQEDKPAVTDTTANQVYSNEAELRKKWGKDYNKNMQKINKAVASTKGEILTYDNAPIFPAFFSTSNGYTENSEDYWENKLPYLRSVKSPWDKNSPKFLDQTVVSIEDAEQALGVDLGDQIQVDIARTDSNRVSKLTVAGKEFSGREIREKFKLRSSDFDIEQKNGHLIFTTKGFGHGIGMSQYGANGMAKNGKSYQDIVKYYYQGVKISEVAETAPTLVAK
ncbi:stage II sporulation protein D [Lentibacillus populi]|uniref:Stage II sporulation protein D n=1 Tax=Lentibacillus populi TaxID=1827502 RepID=A0A9W5X863_9BACI|nr:MULTISPECIES: stage II sporulation protein D [Bacillaceae]GGB62435.1 stage II sporulation protein D [Lentibacillus populi]